MKKIYHKLVRDRIPEIIEKAGKDYAVRQVRSNELMNYALKKLQEEVQEFVEDPCAEEAADIMEIFYFICSRLGLSENYILAERTSKRVARGSFDLGLVLEWVEEK
jgi:predicted house-cleaning noncanonical NTP pyrophosphatase (MazG superfamily)